MSIIIEGLALQRADGVPLLGPLSLALAPGDRLGLVGESGSGKSLLVQALFGALPPGVGQSSGAITAFGARMDQPSPDRDRIRGARLAWMPQDPLQALNPHLTLGEHLALLPGIHRKEPPKAALARLAPLLAQLHLPAEARFLSRFPHQVSGGQRQRICLAIALSCDPELLVLGLILRLLGCRVVYDVHEDVPRQTMGKDWIPLVFRWPVARVIGALEWLAGKSFAAIVPATPVIAARLLAPK